MIDTLTDPADIFREVEPADDDKPRRVVRPEAIEIGESNAVGNVAREKALRANRARFRVKRSGQGELGFASNGAA